MFPDAKFVLIHRDPYEVFSSTVYCFEKVFKMWALQRLGSYDIVESTISNFRDITEKYFTERDLIPDGNLVEIAYTDLDRAPIETLRSVYAAVNLPEFQSVEVTLNRYLDSLGRYEKNRHRQLDLGLQYRLVREWRRYFSEWGYSDHAGPTKRRAA